MNLVKLANESPLVRNLLGVDDWKDIVAITPNAVIRRVGENQFNADFKGHRRDQRTNQMINLIYSDVYKFLGKKHGIQSYAPSPLYSYHLAPQEFMATTGDLKPAAGQVSPVDGLVRRTGINETFATIQAGAGTHAFPSTTQATFGLRASATTDQYDRLGRAYWLFDTSVMGAGAVATIGTLRIYVAAQTVTLGGCEWDIVSSNPASSADLVTADFTAIGTTVYSSIASGSISASAYNDFTLDATGRGTIAPEGLSKFGGRINWDTDDSFGGSWSSSAASTLNVNYADLGSNEPILNVTFSIPSGTAKFATLLGVG